MKTSDTTTKIFDALAKAQGVLEAATKDSTNPAFRSKYADLTSHVEAIRPAAKAHNLSVIQELTSDDNGVAVVTRICHASGEWVECGPLFIPATKHDAQGFGSACSYARRYALSAAFGTIADDDDGNAAVQSKPAQVATRTPHAASTSAAHVEMLNVVPEPIGFKAWLDDMRGMSETADLDTFRDGYKSSPAKHRKYLEETQPHTLTALVERAKQNAPLPVL